MGHRTFSSNISRFDYLINRVQKKVGENNSKSKKKKKQDNRQRQMFQISKLSVPKCF